MLKQKKSVLVFSIIGLPLLAAVSLLSIPPNKVFGGYGEAAPLPGSTTETPVCTNLKPGTPALIVIDSSKPNSAILYWTPADRATHYTIAYGLTPGNYIYGLPKISTGESGYSPRYFTVNHLVNGEKYYFVVRAANDCMPGDFSNELGLVIGQETIALGHAARQVGKWAVPVSQIPSSTGEALGTFTEPTPRPIYSPAPRQLEVRPTPVSPVYPKTVTPTPAPKKGFFGRIIDSLLGR